MRLRHIPAATLIYLAFFAAPSFAQHSISIDLGAIRQKNHHQVGMNLSGFYHFDHHWLGGIEINRFFPVHRNVKGEDVTYSGWDFEANFHYLVSLPKRFNFYPVGGISHTSEKEYNTVSHHDHLKHFWSLNTGAGLNVQLSHWLPHVEYIFTWGHINQQFILVGLGYEIEWGRKGQH
jgi:hypothetical protein